MKNNQSGYLLIAVMIAISIIAILIFMNQGLYDSIAAPKSAPQIQVKEMQVQVDKYNQQASQELEELNK